MGDAAKTELECPVCKTKVVYDPDDPMHHTSGALLRKAGPKKATVVYLTCSQGHLQRYELN
jgi:hypothetical protein